jgi:hypothetical protein
MVLNGDNLRKEAAEARQLASSASNEQDSAFWLRIAEGWWNLAREADEVRGKKP